MIRMRKQRPREESDLPKVTQRDGGRVGTRTKACGSSRHACGPGVSSHLSQHGFLCALGPADKASHRAPTRRFPAPSPCPNPQERPRDQGPPPRSAAGAGDTPSPRQGAWASGATPEIAQLSGPRIRLQPPCPDGAPGRAGITSPSHCLHLLPPSHVSARAVP